MGSEHDQDAALMLRVKAGDTAALEVLINRYKQPVTNLIARMISDPAEAEDLAQNAFVQVYKSASRYTPSAKFSTWLFTIARNLALNELRRRSRHQAESMDASLHDDPPQYADAKAAGPTENLLQGELEQKIQEAIAALPENQRIALLLCQEDDLSYDDISEVLGSSLSATKSLIHRARETLKARLKPYLRTGDWIP